MIIDKLERISHYREVLPHIDQALTTLDSLSEWQEGQRYPFEGGFLFFQKGTTRPLAESQFEAHRKYIDVQVVLNGSEFVAWEELAKLTVAIPYDPEKDVEKYAGATEHYMKVTAGMAYVCYPEDGHKAVFHLDEPQEFTKAVIKLAVN